MNYININISVSEQYAIYSPNRLIVDEATTDDNSGKRDLSILITGTRPDANMQWPQSTPQLWNCFPSSVVIPSSFGKLDFTSLFKPNLIDIASGKKRRDTVLICLSSDDVEEGRIQMNKVARNNLRVKLGDVVNVHQCLDIKYGKRIHVLPFDDSIEGLSGNIFEVYLKPYFLEGQ